MEFISDSGNYWYLLAKYIDPAIQIAILGILTLLSSYHNNMSVPSNLVSHAADKPT